MNNISLHQTKSRPAIRFSVNDIKYDQIYFLLLNCLSVSTFVLQVQVGVNTPLFTDEISYVT